MTKTIANQAAKKTLRQDRPAAAICLTTAKRPAKVLQLPSAGPTKQSTKRIKTTAGPSPSATTLESAMTQANSDHDYQVLNTDLFEPPAWLLEQVATQMPKWAPRALVSELVLYRMTQTEPGSFARQIFEYPDAEQAMLERILTRPGMNIVWQSIAAACDKQGVAFDRFVRQIWHQLAAANAVMNQATKTPTEARDELSEIAQHLRLTIRKIERNRIAKILNRRAIHELTAHKIAGNLPSSDEPLHDQIRMEAQINDDVLTTLADGSARRSAKRQTRLAEALSAAVSLSLIDVATHLIDELERSIAGYKGEVKELGNHAPVFIRRIRGLLKETFGKPMASTVAALLNVALDREFGDITEELVRKTR